MNSWEAFCSPNSRILINVGIYRDDGLTITNATPKDTENIKKEICRIFNNNCLRIIIEANKQIIIFPDVTFNLNRSTYQPFAKPNTSLQYVHRESNHPPITIKNIPPVSTNDCSPYHPTKHPLTKPPLHTRKHSTKVDTTTHYSTNQPKQANGKTDNAITSSGTTLLLARTPAPTSDTNSSPSQRSHAQKNLQAKHHQDQL